LSISIGRPSKLKENIITTIRNASSNSNPTKRKITRGKGKITFITQLVEGVRELVTSFHIPNKT